MLLLLLGRLSGLAYDYRCRGRGYRSAAARFFLFALRPWYEPLAFAAREERSERGAVLGLAEVALSAALLAVALLSWGIVAGLFFFGIFGGCVIGGDGCCRYVGCCGILRFGCGCFGCGGRLNVVGRGCFGGFGRCVACGVLFRYRLCAFDAAAPFGGWCRLLYNCFGFGGFLLRDSLLGLRPRFLGSVAAGA